MFDSEGILPVIVSGAADWLMRRHDTVLQAIKRYFGRVSKQLNVNPNLLLNALTVELVLDDAKEVQMTTKITLCDSCGRDYNVKPDVSIVKLSDVPENLRNRISADCAIDATPEIRAKVMQGLRRWAW